MLSTNSSLEYFKKLDHSKLNYEDLKKFILLEKAYEDLKKSQEKIVQLTKSLNLPDPVIIKDCMSNELVAKEQARKYGLNHQVPYNGGTWFITNNFKEIIWSNYNLTCKKCGVMRNASKIFYWKNNGYKSDCIGKYEFSCGCSIKKQKK